MARETPERLARTTRQYNQSVGYRTPLEARIAKKTTKAITDFNLVEDGDRIMVGLSGGKDSWALIQILDVLQQRAPIDFSIVAVNVDSGYEGYQHTQVAAACQERGWEFHSEHTTIGAVIDDKLESDDTPCSLCARLRRGVLYRLAKQTGATKIALGHHLDDFVETVLLNLFFAGALKAMPARLTSDNGAARGDPPAGLRHRGRGARLLQGARAADHRLLLPGVRRPQPAAPARQAADRRARARAPQRQGVDDQGARQRHAAPPARSPAESGRRDHARPSRRSSRNSTMSRPTCR